MRHPYTAEREESILLIIDIQQAMLKAIPTWEATLRRVIQMIQAAKALDIPILLTEHYKKGLGETVPEVKSAVGNATFFQKEYFSACLEKDFLETVAAFGRKKIVLVGMETHVCALQTGLDLIQAGYQLQAAQNALASRYPEDWKTAIKLFREAGAVITTAEIVIFQWACRSNTDEFRKILPIVK
jgi:nicotinamidase-related amidase